MTTAFGAMGGTILLTILILNHASTEVDLTLTVQNFHSASGHINHLINMIQLYDKTEKHLHPAKDLIVYVQR